MLASSAKQSEFDHYVGLLGVGDIIAANTTIDDVDRSKPEPAIFAAALRKIELAVTRNGVCREHISACARWAPHSQMRETIVKRLILGAALSMFTATAAFAVTPQKFIETAGASDTFEIDSARLMVTSKNHAVSRFATAMIGAHTKSTKMIKAAAQADHLGVKKPSLSFGQRTDLTALKAVPDGKTKDDLYIKQQKAAHDDALALMKNYAANGSAKHLRMTAGKIAPVVEMHEAMLAKL